MDFLDKTLGPGMVLVTAARIFEMEMSSKKRAKC
jgi:hypothetical protein